MPSNSGSRLAPPGLSSAQEEALRALYQTEKLAAVGQLAAGMAHEINNPLSFVRSNLSTFERYLSKFADLRKQLPLDEAGWRQLDLDFVIEDGFALLRDSADGLERIARIVADLKDFSGVAQADAEFADLNDCLRRAAAMSEQALPPGIVIRLELQPLPSMICLPGSLNQVFFNVIRNAVQAIVDKGGRGKVTISSEANDAGLAIRIHDDGVGMGAVQLDHAFEPFYTTRPVGSGVGLGLATARNVVLAHGGGISLDSRPGGGTTVTIVFPVPT
jgi:two-component system, NtrC family, sensor kinase